MMSLHVVPWRLSLVVKAPCPTRHHVSQGTEQLQRTSPGVTHSHMERKVGRTSWGVHHEQEGSGTPRQPCLGQGGSRSIRQRGHTQGTGAAGRDAERPLDRRGRVRHAGAEQHPQASEPGLDWSRSGVAGNVDHLRDISYWRRGTLVQ
jgi:hypothetical protein